ncbi:hypothetical protein [Neomicrococcus lactis]|uniref:CBM2 domain-containing protein n=1 Tax=Neomicrococcus lactis TaxID=732241 RepID=A0A7W8Y9I3_9MICC|nr:hypothetical protein [Neomicrococcus lactis]MBB5597160.1 hypothetical protein [Neomicrococcus lactis]
MTEQNSRGVSRRSITKGVAWAAPVVAVATAAPFAAASHHEPPPPVSVAGKSCKTGGNSGTITKGFYGQFSVTNNTGASLTYTITSFLSAAQVLTNVQVMPITSTDWSGKSTTFTVPNGGTTTFLIRGSGHDSGNTSFTMNYTVVGFGDTFTAKLTYNSMDTCCNPAPLCPPGAYKAGAAPTTAAKQATTESSVAPTKEAAKTQAPTTQTAKTQAPATSAPATETKVAQAPASSAPATSAPASASASE